MFPCKLPLVLYEWTKNKHAYTQTKTGDSEIRDDMFLVLDTEPRCKARSPDSSCWTLPTALCYLTNKRYKNFYELYLIVWTPGCRWEGWWWYPESPPEKFLLNVIWQWHKERQAFQSCIFLGMTSSATEESGMLWSMGSQIAGHNYSWYFTTTFGENEISRWALTTFCPVFTSTGLFSSFPQVLLTFII